MGLLLGAIVGLIVGEDEGGGVGGNVDGEVEGLKEGDLLGPTVGKSKSTGDLVGLDVGDSVGGGQSLTLSTQENAPVEDLQHIGVFPKHAPNPKTAPQQSLELRPASHVAHVSLHSRKPPSFAFPCMQQGSL